MLAARIIPSMLCKGPQLVKGKQFDPWRIVGALETAVKIHATRGVDEMLLLDVVARKQRRLFDLEMLLRLTAKVFVPLTVGGGVRGVDDVVQLLLHGADKVAIGSTAFSVIKPAAQKLGTQAIVAMVDYDIDGMVTVGGAMVDALSYAQMCEKQGAGEVVLQSKVRDGTMAGYDIKMLQRVASQLSIPVIVAGGCRDVSDMSIALRSGAQGVAVGALFQFCDITPREAAQVLKACGHEVRL